MKMKKTLSLMTAAAIAAAGFAAFASAAAADSYEKSYTITNDGTANNLATAANNSGTYSVSKSGGSYYFNLTVLSNDIDAFKNSDYVELSFNIPANGWYNGGNHAGSVDMDITQTNPETKNNNRIVRINAGTWQQINALCGSREGFGAGDGDNGTNQILNLDSKAINNANTDVSVSVKIDRISSKITVTSNSKTGYMTDFTNPSDFNNLYFAIYPNNDNPVTINNLQVHYGKSDNPSYNIIGDTAESYSYNGGMFTIDKSEAVAGETVTVTPTAYDHYTVGTVSYNGTAITPVNGIYSFTMPPQNTTVTATFNRTDNSVVKFFCQADSVSNCRKTIDQNAYTLNYVYHDSSATFEGITLENDSSYLDSITIYSSNTNSNNGNPIYVAFNDGEVQLLSSGTTEGSSKPGNKYYTFTGRKLKYNGSYSGDSLTVTFKNPDNPIANGDHLGNYWYIALNYAAKPGAACTYTVKIPTVDTYSGDPATGIEAAFTVSAGSPAVRSITWTATIDENNEVHARYTGAALTTGTYTFGLVVPKTITGNEGDTVQEGVITHTFN